MVLQPNGTQRIAKLRVKGIIPGSEIGQEVVLKFEDGFKPSWSNPVNNRVTFASQNSRPGLGECRFTIRAQKGKQVPGDFDQNGALDISDAVSLLGSLFLGEPDRLPCGDFLSLEPGNLALLDWQSDGSLDLADPIALIWFLFLGGPLHRLAVPGNELRGCVPILGCPDLGSCP